MKKEIEVGDVLNIREVGQRGFDTEELFNAIRRLQIVWCWGPQAWTSHKDQFLRFKSNGYLFKGHVYITLGWDDTFTIIYSTLKGKVVDIQTGIYVESLVETIDRKIETK